MIEPYYSEDGITLYCARAEEVLPQLTERWNLVLTDPPYGIELDTDYSKKGSGGLAYEAVAGDGFGDIDLSWLTKFNCTTVLWGAHSYYWYLPKMKNPGWICWDKRVIEDADKMRGVPFELAWVNIPRYFRMLRVQHGGVVNADGMGIPRVHPTQKPVKLFARIIDEHTSEGDIVFDPYVGSGTTLLAAKRLKRRAVGIETSGHYCQIAVDRLRQYEMQFDENGHGT